MPQLVCITLPTIQNSPAGHNHVKPSGYSAFNTSRVPREIGFLATRVSKSARDQSQDSRLSRSAGRVLSLDRHPSTDSCVMLHGTDPSTSRPERDADGRAPCGAPAVSRSHGMFELDFDFGISICVQNSPPVLSTCVDRRQQSRPWRRRFCERGVNVVDS